MNILITGGAGFIASHIAKAYIKENHRVVILDNLSSGDKDNLPPEATFYQMDILDPKVPEILQKEKIDLINHHAAQISVHRSVIDPVFDANSNIIGTLQLLQGAIKSGVKKIIFASTGGAIYGEQDYFPACEAHPCKPLSPYAVAKLSVEKYLLFYERNFNLKSTVFRYSNVYGPGQKSTGEAGVVAIYCERLVKNQAPIVYGTGEQTRDFISVRDVVQANLIALKPECNGIFNIGTGTETSVNELSSVLIKLAGGTLKAELGPARVYEQCRSSIDAKKFTQEFGWKPLLTLEKGLSETLEYFKNKDKNMA